MKCGASGFDARLTEMLCGGAEEKGEEVPRDAFGHIKLDKVNPGAWFAKQFADKIGAEKVRA